MTPVWPYSKERKTIPADLILGLRLQGRSRNDSGLGHPLQEGRFRNDSGLGHPH